jgi:hypothetical protein
MTLTATGGQSNIKRAIMSTFIRRIRRPTARTIGMIATLTKERQVQNYNSLCNLTYNTCVKLGFVSYRVHDQ